MYQQEKEKVQEYEKQLDLDYVDKNYVSKEYYEMVVKEQNDIINDLQEKNKKLKDVINNLAKVISNLAKGVRYLGTNEELTEEDIIKMFSPEEIKMDFDDFMKRWEDKQHKEAKLKENVIDMMAEDLFNGFILNFNSIEQAKEYYFKKARGE